MIKIVIPILLITSIIIARENPFLPFGYKREKKSKNLVKEEFKFPKNTKKIRRIIFEYINEDGTVSLKSIYLDKFFNPNNKMVIMQGNRYFTIPKLVGKEDKNNHKILDDSYVSKHFVNVYEKRPRDRKKIINQKDENPKNDLDKEIVSEKREKFLDNIKDDEPVEDAVLIKKLVFYKEIKIDLYQNKFLIYTKDKIRKKFILKREAKIVIDFNRKLNKKTKLQRVNRDRYKDVIIGIHSDYYRVVVKLDKLKTYKIKKRDNFYEITFK